MKMQEASLFGFDDEEMRASSRPPIPHVAEWPQIMRLDKERELVGMYLSAHPLDPYFIELNYGMSCSMKDKNDITGKDGQTVTFGGMVISNESKMTQSGYEMAIVKLEDFSGAGDFTLFGRKKAELQHLCQVGDAIVVTARFATNSRTGQMRLNVENVRPLAEMRGHLVNGISIHLNSDQFDDNLERFFAEHDAPQDNTAEAEGTAPEAVPVDFVVFEPVINRRIKLNSAIRLPLTRKILDIIENDLGLEYSIQRAS